MTTKKTLILCFVHGFKGDESTFGEKHAFTEHLRGAVAGKLPKVEVRALVYPRFETRGDLGQCVMRFRDWLEEKTIDLEVAAGTPSPTVDPSVRIILVGHSMGGIVAAEMVIGLASEKAIYSQDGIEKAESPKFNSLMFPYVQGVLAFDTPFLGISPGVVAHGAEGHYRNAAAAMSQLSGLSAAIWGSDEAGASAGAGRSKAVAAAPSSDDKASGAWARWGKAAMYAGAAGAVAAGGAAAWMNRDQISSGWTWASSHLEFVGCLARAEELKKRVGCMVQLRDELGLGFANLYTRLGRAAPPKQTSVVGTVLGPNRTFCNLPRKLAAGDWHEAVNDKAPDEVSAHINMFEPQENPGYETMTEEAAGFIANWCQNDWYASSTEGDDAQSVQPSA